LNLFRETNRRLEDQENERERFQISVDARHFPAFFFDEQRRATTTKKKKKKKIIETNVPTSRDGRATKGDEGTA
jgi:hypothetical protein